VDAMLAMHWIETLSAVVVRRQILVADRPRRRHAIDVRDFVKVLAAKAVPHAAPELSVAADAIVRIRRELLAVVVEPPFRRPVTQLLPDGLGTPVLRFLWNETAALDDQQ